MDANLLLKVIVSFTNNREKRTKHVTIVFFPKLGRKCLHVEHQINNKDSTFFISVSNKSKISSGHRMSIQFGRKKSFVGANGTDTIHLLDVGLREQKSQQKSGKREREKLRPCDRYVSGFRGEPLFKEYMILIAELNVLCCIKHEQIHLHTHTQTHFLLLHLIQIIVQS